MENNSNTKLVALEEGHSKSSSGGNGLRKKLLLGLGGLMLIGAAGAATYFVAFHDKDGSSGGGATSEVKFGFDKVANPQGGRRRLDGSLIGAGGFGEEPESFRYAVTEVLLCSSEQISTFVVENKVITELEPVDCVSVFQADVNLVNQASGCDGAVNELFVDLMNPTEVAENLSFTAQVPVGLYKHAIVKVLPHVEVRASVSINGGAATLHTKQCGPTTCGSQCAADASYCSGVQGRKCASNMRDCGGKIDSAPLEGTNFGDIHPATEDIWTNHTLSNPGGYWRRCEHDMLQGPAEAVKVVLRGNNKDDKLISTFVTPFEVQEGAGPLDLKLQYSLEHALLGTVKPLEFLSSENAYQHVNYYGVSDGVLGIEPQPLSLAPVVLEQGEGVFKLVYRIKMRTAKSEPVCFTNMTDFVVSSATGACHPCQTFTGGDPDFHCYNFDEELTMAETFDITGMTVPQDFDIYVSLFLTGNATGSAYPNFEQPRGASVRAQVAPSEDTPKAEIPFSPMRVEKVTATVAENGDIWYDLHYRSGTSLFPRIRRLPLLVTSNQQSNQVIAQVENTGIVSNQPPPHEKLGGSTDLFFTGEVEFQYAVFPSTWTPPGDEGEEYPTCTSETDVAWMDLPFDFDVPAPDSTDKYLRIYNGNGTRDLVLHTLLGSFRARGYPHSSLDGEGHARFYGMVAEDFSDPNYIHYNGTHFQPGGCEMPLAPGHLCLMHRDYLAQFANMMNYRVPETEGNENMTIVEIRVKNPTNPPPPEEQQRWFPHLEQMEIVGILGGCVSISFVHVGSLSEELRAAIVDAGGVLPEDIVWTNEMVQVDVLENATVSLAPLTPLGNGQLTCKPEYGLGSDSNGAFYYSSDQYFGCWVQIEPDYILRYGGSLGGISTIFDPIRLNATIRTGLQKVLNNALLDGNMPIFHNFFVPNDPYLLYAQSNLNAYPEDRIPFRNEEFDALHTGGGTWAEHDFDDGAVDIDSLFVFYIINRDNVEVFNPNLYTDANSEMLVSRGNLSAPETSYYGEILGALPPGAYQEMGSGTATIHWRSTFGPYASISSFQSFSWRLLEDRLILAFGSEALTRIAAEADMPAIPPTNPICSGDQGYKCFGHNFQYMEKFRDAGVF